MALSVAPLYAVRTLMTRGGDTTEVGARPQRLHQSVMIGPQFPRIGSVFGSAVPAMRALVA